MVLQEITTFIISIHRYLESELTGSIPKDTADSTIKNIAAVESKWKKVFWEKNSVEPAMLRVPLIIILFLFLWGINVWVLDRFRIQHQPVVKSPASVSFILITSFFLMSVYAVSMTFSSTLLGFSVEFGVTSFYILLTFLAIMPLPGQEARSAFYRLTKTVFFPLNSISFPEVLLADAMTSLSKVFKDICVTFLVVYCYLSGENIIRYHDFGIVAIAILSSLPYAIRVKQCWVQFVGCQDGVNRVPIGLNLLKYCSAFPPIWLAASVGLGYHHSKLLVVTETAATINSLYSYAWDVVMDWGMITFYRNGKVQLRQRSYFHWTFYIVLLVINFILRFSWKANRISWLRALHSSHLVLVLEVAEVCRRALWNVVRVEWEVIVQQEKKMESVNPGSVEDPIEENKGGGRK